MNKSETAKYEKVKKFLMPLTLRDNRVTISYDGDTSPKVLCFDDEEGRIWFKMGNHKYGVFDLIDCEDMTITTIKAELKDRIKAYQEIDW